MGFRSPEAAVIFETTKIAKKLRGIVTIPGWLKGTQAFLGSKPYMLLYISGHNAIHSTELTVPRSTPVMIPCLVVPL